MPSVPSGLAVSSLIFTPTQRDNDLDVVRRIPVPEVLILAGNQVPPITPTGSTSCVTFPTTTRPSIMLRSYFGTSGIARKDFQCRTF